MTNIAEKTAEETEAKAPQQTAPGGTRATVPSVPTAAAVSCW